MDLDKSIINIDNEDDIYLIDEENKKSLGEETFCAEESFLTNEENIKYDEENNSTFIVKKTKKEENKKIDLPQKFFGVFASIVASILIIGTSIGFIPSIISTKVSNFILRSNELGFEVNKDLDKVYLMSLFNDDYDYKEDAILTDKKEYVFTDLNPSTVYNFELYDITDGMNKKLYSANYLTKDKDKYSAEIINSKVIDNKLFFNVKYEGEGIEFVTIDIILNGNKVLVYEGIPKEEFEIELNEEFSELKCRILINGNVTNFKDFINDNDEDINPDENPDQDPSDNPEDPGKDETIQVESISINTKELYLMVDDTMTPIVTILPENATNKNVTWQSSNTDVVIVEDGTIKAVGEGSATVYVTTEDGNYEASCSITVSPKEIAVDSIELSESELNLFIGESSILRQIISPEDATDKSVTWASTNEDVATVSMGLVIAVAEGNATISATTTNGLVAYCNVVVKKKVTIESITLDTNEAELVIGNDKTLTATILPADATEDVIWSSSDEKVATVSNGKITAIGVGEATITVTNQDGTISDECIVIVGDGLVHVTSVTIDYETLSIEHGKNQQLTATVLPENAVDTSVTWTSSNEDVATVTSGGYVRTVGVGEATITATATDGNISGSCQITVTPATPTFSNIFIAKNMTNSGNKIMTFDLGYEDKSKVWNDEFYVKVATGSYDGDVLFEGRLYPAANYYGAFTGYTGKFILESWQESYYDTLQNTNDTYYCSIYALDTDEYIEENSLKTRRIYGGSAFTNGLNPVPGSIILDENVTNESTGDANPTFHISSTKMTGYDSIDVTFTNVSSGEVITVSSITLDEVTTANISIPSGSTEYNVLVVGHKDGNSINIVNETITLTN